MKPEQHVPTAGNCNPLDLDGVRTRFVSVLVELTARASDRQP